MKKNNEADEFSTTPPHMGLNHTDKTYMDEEDNEPQDVDMAESPVVSQPERDAFAPAPDFLKQMYDEIGDDHDGNDDVTSNNPEPGDGIESVDISLEDLDIPNKFKKQILYGVGEKGERSEPAFEIIKALIRSGSSDSEIIGIFKKYAVGERYREKPGDVQDHMMKEIDRAKASIQEEDKRADEAKVPRDQQVAQEALDEMVIEHIAHQGQLFIRMRVNGDLATYNISSTQFETAFEGYCVNKYGTLAPPRALDSFRRLIRIKQQSGAMSNTGVFLRVARHDDAIYINKADGKWGAIRIDGTGFSNVAESPVPMLHKPNMLPLPDPVPGDLGLLRGLINCQEDKTGELIAGWLINCLQPGGPYYHLAINGPAGSGKSSMAKFLHMLIDPSKSTAKHIPDKTDDLMVSALNNYLLNFDNISSLNSNMPDTLCILATGGGYATRKFYTHDEEFIIESANPVILNGINNFIVKNDLLDRTIFIELGRVPEDARKPLKEMEAAFYEKRPQILGGLYSAITTALRNYSSVSLPYLPRMADAAKWVSAAEEALGWSGTRFLEAVSDNHKNAASLAIKNDPVLSAIANFMETHTSWSGSTTELLGLLERHRDPNLNTHSWPTQGNALSRKINTGIPVLERKGIRVELGRSSTARTITITKGIPSDQND